LGGINLEILGEHPTANPAGVGNSQYPNEEFELNDAKNQTVRILQLLLFRCLVGNTLVSPVSTSFRLLDIEIYPAENTFSDKVN